MNLMNMKKLKIKHWGKEVEVNLYDRKSLMAELKDFDYLSEKSDFIEVTEWKNGEGYDIALSDKQVISITIGQFDAIKKLIKLFNKL
jgi:hypothetical protein